MKKVISIILLFIIMISGIIYLVILKTGKEEFEILNNDVSVNNVKSILNIENETEENINEIPLGYKDGKIYLLKYNFEQSAYERDIYTLNEDGSTEKTEIQLPEYYTKKNISLYGEKIFAGNRCFNWNTGEDISLFSSNESEDILCKPVSGNRDYFLFIKNYSQQKEYTLYDIESRKYYDYIDNGENDNIQNVFYDKSDSKFYSLNSNYEIRRINLGNNQFTTENYDEIKSIDKSEEDEEINYVFCNNGKIYIGQGFKEGLDTFNNQENTEFNVSSYSISDKENEKINKINICEYDAYYNDCIIIKTNDEENNNRFYFSKFKNSGPDIIMELYKEYGNESYLSINIIESGNILIKETYYDKEKKKIRNKYSVYDLKEYFNDNEYVLNDDGVWSEKDQSDATLKYTIKNINDSQQDNTQDSDQNVKNEAEKIISETNNISDNSAIVSNNREDDFREHDPSWRKGEVQWYYYDENNNKVTGWVKSGDGWYYFDKDGVMQKNAIVIENGQEFNLDENGKLVIDENTDILEKSVGKDKQTEDIEEYDDVDYEETDNTLESKSEDEKDEGNKDENSKDENNNIDNEKNIEVQDKESDKK